MNANLARSQTGDESEAQAGMISDPIRHGSSRSSPV